MNNASLPMLWATCVERLKDKVNNRSFWEAIEHSRAVTIDGDNLIIGLSEENFSYAGVINQGALQHTINQTISQVFGMHLKYRLIDGVNVTDWEETKAREARVIAARQAASAPVAAAPTASTDIASWDGVMEGLARLFQETPSRQFPQGKAQFASEALYLLAKAMQSFYPENPDETTERALARAIERIALSSEMPAAVIAFELERLRAFQRGQAQ